MSLSYSIDFVSDWRRIVVGQIMRLGYPEPPPDRAASDVAIDYFNALRRRIAPRPRKVLFASGFSCPAHRQAGLNALTARLAAGDDVFPYLSDKVADELEHDDWLLNDWGIYHFHLGEHKNERVGRTKELAFAYLTEDAAYLLRVLNHRSFEEMELVELLHEHFPDAIRSSRLPEDVLDVDWVASSARDVVRLRAAGINYFFKTRDGTLYGSLGGGYASDRTSHDAVFDGLKSLRTVRAWQEEAVHWFLALPRRRPLVAACIRRPIHIGLGFRQGVAFAGSRLLADELILGRF